jgi:hypothetical protein
VLSTNENRHEQIVADLPRYRGLSLTERLKDRGDLMKSVPMIVVKTMKDAAERIEYLEYHLRLRDQ